MLWELLGAVGAIVCFGAPHFQVEWPICVVRTVPCYSKVEPCVLLSCADTARPARVRVYGQGHGTMLHRTGRTLPHAPSARVQSLLPAPHAPLRRTRSKLSRSASVDASHAMQMMGVLLSTLIHRCWRTISECIIPCLVPAVQSLRQLVCRLSLGLVFSRQAAGSGRPGMPARVRVWADWPMSYL
jgi:hypothetical protein